jgi:hypothetical protein
MTTVVADSVSDQRIRRDSEGYSVERVYIVSDLPGQADAKLFKAISDPNIPQYGDAHPVIAGISVTDVTAEPIMNQADQFQVTVVYSVPSDDDATDTDPEGRALITSSLTNETTHFDINGELIKARYVSGVNSISTKYSPVEVQRPQLRVTLTRKENAAPKSSIEKYHGKINSVDWSGFPPQTWLCSGISARENDDGTWNVDYSFEYRRERWKGELVVPLSAAQAEDNPIDKDQGNGYALFDVYETANFNSLGLRF